jgi:riboflavin transporter FmnP
MEKNSHFPTRRMRWITLVGMMSALTYILYLPIFRIPIILFLELNLSEVVIFIGGFSLGPLAAIFIGLFRFLFSLLYSTTGGIGELADYIYSMAFVLPGVILYQRHRDKKTASIGFIIGFISQLIVTSLLNALVITDLYLTLFLNLTPEAFLGYIQTVLPHVENPYWSLVLWMYLPFNIFKNLVVIALTLFTYKRTHRFIKKIS